VVVAAVLELHVLPAGDAADEECLLRPAQSYQPQRARAGQGNEAADKQASHVLEKGGGAALPPRAADVFRS
jgi:hypothetical protein